jgi:D-amino-acid dehydrogenase
MTKRPIVIVGGGVIGVCCAYFLAKRGARVIVLERDEIGKGASYGNAGCIASGHTPINRPGRIRQALKSLFDPKARYLWRRGRIPRSPNGFGHTCTERHVELAMRTLAPPGCASRRLFDELIATESLACGSRGEGYYEICLTERGLESARKEAGVVSRFGFHPQMLTGRAVREREPAINDRVVGGVFFPEAATGRSVPLRSRNGEASPRVTVRISEAAQRLSLSRRPNAD